MKTMPHLLVTVAFATLPLSLLTAANYDLETYSGIDVGDKTTLGVTTTPLIYMDAFEDTTNSKTVTYFGGYHTAHDFIWEIGKDSSPTTLMFLSTTGVLELYDSAVGGNYISFDPGNAQIQFGDNDGTGNNDILTLSVNEVGGMGKLTINDGVNDYALVTQDTNGVIAQDMTLEGSLKIKNAAGGDIILSVADTEYGGQLQSDDATGFYTGKVMLGYPPRPVNNNFMGTPGLYSHDSDGIALFTHDDSATGGATVAGFDVDEGFGARERMFISTGRPDAAGAGFRDVRTFSVKLYSTSTPAISMITASQNGPLVAVNSSYTSIPSGYNFYVAGGVLFSGSTAIKGSSTYDATESKYLGGASLIAGSHNSASGVDAHAIGHNVDADSFASVVLGSGNADPAQAQDAVNWVPSDELFVVGNGYDADLSGIIDSGEKSNALVITKDGNAAFSSEVTVAGKAVFADEVDITTIATKGDIVMGAFGSL